MGGLSMRLAWRMTSSAMDLTCRVEVPDAILVSAPVVEAIVAAAVVASAPAPSAAKLLA